MTIAHRPDGYYRTLCGIFMGVDWSARSNVYVKVPGTGRLPSWARWCRTCNALSGEHDGV